jgi:signal transduction histidine kinase
MGQMLTGIKLNLQEVRQQVNADAAKKIGSIQQDIGDLMIRMRDLSARLRPSLLDDLGLLPALQWHIERFSKQTRVRVDFQHEGVDRRLPHETSLTLFRIVQESLTNAVRHSGAKSVKITLMTHDGTIHVIVRDEGTGFDPEDALNRRTTLGLAGMRERVEMVGGSLLINSAKGKGTEIRCSIPVDGTLPHFD